MHRIFEAGHWWASDSSGQWPACEEQRTRLLERWHPRFGDRRQELVFVGVDVDRDRLVAELDRCLVAEKDLEFVGEQRIDAVSLQRLSSKPRLH